MEANWSGLIQSVLMTVIQVLLPVVLGYIVVWINAKVKEAKAKLSESQLTLATGLIYQLVLAAEQNGLIGAIEDIGTEKKQYVLMLADAELNKHGIDLDFEVLDALVEAAVYEAFKQLDPILEPPIEGEG